MSDDFVTNFTAEDAREKIARKKDLEEYQRVKKQLSLNIQKAIDEGAKFRCSICGEEIATAAYKILAALELGYEVSNVKRRDNSIWADIYWGEEVTVSITSTPWATVSADTISLK